MSRFGLDIGNFVKGVYGGASSTSGASAVTLADSTNDNTAVTGAAVNRLQSTGTIAQSCVVLIPYLATLSEAETVSFTVKLKDSADGSTFGNEVVLQAATVAATGSTGGSNEHGIVEINVNLGSYRQYIQINVTPNLSQADIPDDDGAGPDEAVEATDNAVWAVVVLLGGFGTAAI